MFKTPKGLKVRLDIPYGFALLARLWRKDPNTDAFKVLKTCEGLECIRPFLGFIGGMVGLILGPNIWYVPLGIVIGSILGKILTAFGLFIIPGLPSVGVLFSWGIGYGVFTLIGIALAWILRGWIFAVAWLGGFIAAYIVVLFFLEGMIMNYYSKRVGYPVTTQEINFLNAYRLHADRLGMPRNLDVPEEEIAAGYWEECLQDYGAKYPEAVARFMG